MTCIDLLFIIAKWRAFELQNDVHWSTYSALSLHVFHLIILQPAVNAESKLLGINTNMKQSNSSKKDHI